MNIIDMAKREKSYSSEKSSFYNANVHLDR